MKQPGWRTWCAVIILVGGGLLASCSPPAGNRAPTAGAGSPSPQAVALTPEMVARQEIQARYDAMAKALQAKDIKAYMQSFSPDYNFTNEIGDTDSRATVESQMAAALSYTDTLSYEARVADCKLQDSRAYVMVNETMRSTKKGKNLIEVHHLLQATWVKDASGWKLAHSREKTGTMTHDEPTPMAAGQASPSTASPPPGSPVEVASPSTDSPHP